MWLICYVRHVLAFCGYHQVSNYKILWGKNNFRQEFSVIQGDLIFYSWNSLVWYGCETWSLTLREGRRLRVFVNRVLRKIFWPKRDAITREWRKLHNEELNPLNAELNSICHLLALLGVHHFLHVSRIRVNDLYSSPNIVRVIKSRRMRWAGHAARVGERRGV
jgi:hypothetical protein